MNRNLSKMYALLLVLLAIAYASCDEFPFDGLGGADPDLTDTIYDPVTPFGLMKETRQISDGRMIPPISIGPAIL